MLGEGDCVGLATVVGTDVGLVVGLGVAMVGWIVCCGCCVGVVSGVWGAVHPNKKREVSRIAVIKRFLFMENVLNGL
jgi:hypothetical protein